MQVAQPSGQVSIKQMQNGELSPFCTYMYSIQCIHLKCAHVPFPSGGFISPRVQASFMLFKFDYSMHSEGLPKVRVITLS